MVSMAPPALGPFAGAQAVHGVADRLGDGTRRLADNAARFRLIPRANEFAPTPDAN